MSKQNTRTETKKKAAKETTITVEIKGTVEATVVLPGQDAEHTIEVGDHQTIANALLWGLLGRADHAAMKDGEIVSIKVFDTGREASAEADGGTE